MLSTLQNIDTQLFLAFNGCYCSFCDVFMFYVSERFIWIPFYTFLLYLVIKKKGKDAVYAVTAVVLLIILSDQVSVLIKNNVQRLRPCHEPTLQALIHLVNNKCGGQFGFVSSHAANCMGLTVMLSTVIKKNWFTAMMLCWTLLVSYSRIYLGAHYPGDIIGGWLLGSICTLFIYLIFNKFIKPPTNELAQ